MSKTPIILGAGLAGCLAACTQFQTSRIYEAQSKENLQKHKALLRFRSSAIGDALGIEFKKVTVHKGIWYKGAFHQPNPMLCNMYSHKVANSIQDRSIWNIDTCERWIAPEDFHEQLLDRCNGRIKWKEKFDGVDSSFSFPIISTVPMFLMARKHFPDIKLPEFKSQEIYIKRWHIPYCNTHQTIYFPDCDYGLYRASITGDILTAEYAWQSEDDGDMFEAFDIYNVNPLDESSQHLGKISPIDNQWRKQFIFDLSHKHNIYSLGRFATWRQILLDDVLQDINVIKKMINNGSYESAMVNANAK